MTAPDRHPARPLDQVSTEIRTVWAEAKGHQMAAIQGYLRVGRLLSEAREQFPSDRKYSQWFRAQGFGFGTEWGRRMRFVAAHPDEVANVVASALATGATLPGLDRLIEYIEHMGIRDWWDPATIHTEPLTPLPGGRDPRTTGELLARLTAYSADLRELLLPGADHVARQIAAAGDPWADRPGTTESTEHLREQAAALHDLAAAVEDLASRVEVAAAAPTAGPPTTGADERPAPARRRRSPRSG